MGGPAGVLGRSSGVLGLAWGFMGGAWCVLGVAWSVLGGRWEVLERPSRCLWEGPWRSLGGPRQVAGGPWTSLGGSLRVLGGPWGGPREVPGGPWGGLGGPQNRRCFFRAFWEGPGGRLGWFWCSGMVLGSVLGSQNVGISWIIMMF